MEALREQRESTICSTREELYSAQEEVRLQLVVRLLGPLRLSEPCLCLQVLVLRHAMEAATADREREIAALQADLGKVRTELEHWRTTAAKYEEEIGRLQGAFSQQQLQQHTASQLQSENLCLIEPLCRFLFKCVKTERLLFSQRSALRCTSGVRLCSRSVTV